MAAQPVTSYIVENLLSTHTATLDNLGHIDCWLDAVMPKEVVNPLRSLITAFKSGQGSSWNTCLLNFSSWIARLEESPAQVL